MNILKGCRQHFLTAILNATLNAILKANFTDRK